MYNKARALNYITKNQDGFAEYLQEFEESDDRIDSRYFESLRAELHFMEMHQFEASFALLIAIYQPKPHWIYLTEYTNKEIKTAAEVLIKKDIAALTRGEASTVVDFVTQAVYSGLVPASDEDLRTRWNENTDNVGWLLERMAGRYIEGIEYNSYKHGLRVMTGPHAFHIRPQAEDGSPQAPIFTAASADALSYLELDRANQSGKSVIDVYEVMQHFNPDESFLYLRVMHQLTQTIVSTRLFGLQHRSNSRHNDARVVAFSFLSLNRYDVLQLGSSNM